MKLFLLYAIVVLLGTNSLASPRDTIDVWKVRLNGKPYINSNEIAMAFDQPIVINLSALSDEDTLDLCYWTDHGAQIREWRFIFTDSSFTFVKSFTNPIDSAIRVKDLTWRKNYISFRVYNLREILSAANQKRLIVHFEFAEPSLRNRYCGKTIFIITTD